MALFENESKEVRQKVVFIHFNHTNPLHHLDSREAEIVADKGYQIGIQGNTFKL